MKKTAVCIALVGLVALGGQAVAVTGTVDDVPAATLLLPYFEVNLNDPNALTTLFSVNNASAAPAIAHVTLWTDLSVPTLDFNIYLTGYDVQTINLRDVFNGIVPITEDENDADDISPVGAFSLVTNPLTGVGPGAPNCDVGLPNGALPPVLLNHIRNAHTGQPSAVFLGDCSGVDYGDNIARGYITVDSVSECSLQFPGDLGYFAVGGTGVANNSNQLWGDYFYVDVLNNFAQGETLVHIEADAALGDDNYTFYDRFTAGEDEREGLTSTFAVRFATSFGPIPGGTDLIVWRDGQQTISPFTCGTIPSPFPLAQDQIVIFDEMENPDVPETSPFSPAIPGASLIPFPWEAQRTAVGGVDFPVQFGSGWLYLNLNTTIAGSQVNENPPYVQNWVTTIMSADGRFSVGYDAIQLDNVTFAADRSDLCLGDPAMGFPQPCT